ncbi:MAG: cyclic nucleotide-binding domain-containing protein [Elusimicrobia bacterium]|nr:cyclic nucleotide-binding domain-containing protein [Elusimicrobiota bacterium]MBD3411565.1 cyclic nucleotide-binding domain-containing protein [Elusimicrobiota bacterium]
MEDIFKQEYYKSLTPEDVSIVINNTTKRNVKKDEIIFEEGVEGNEAYIIQSGLVRIYKKVSATDQIVTLAVLKQGMIFGEMAVFEGIPRYAYAAALADSELLVLTKKKFQEIKNNSPIHALAIVNVFMKFLGLYLRRTTDRVYGIYDTKHPSSGIEESWEAH